MEALINSYIEKNIPIPKFINTKFQSLYWDSESSNSIIVSMVLKPMALNRRILNLIDEFKTLEDNWDFDNAKAPDFDAIRFSEMLTIFFQNIGQKIYHAASGPNGEIMLDLRNNEHSKSLEFIIYHNKTIVVFVPKEGMSFQEEFNLKKMKEYLNWLNK